MSTTSLGRRYAHIVVAMAAIPLENTAAISPRSHSVRRSSRTSRLGLLNREYTKPLDCPGGNSRRPDVKSKKSLPSCAVRNTKVEVKKIGGLSDPSDNRGS